MADVHSKEVRSYNMSRIKSKDTNPEMVVRKFLFKMGFRYRLHHTNLPGKPDIVLSKHRAAVFIHGCFWHGHEHCKYYTVPKTRTEWWVNKVAKTKQNDLKALSLLQQSGYRIVQIWECQLKKSKAKETLDILLKQLS